VKREEISRCFQSGIRSTHPAKGVGGNRRHAGIKKFLQRVKRKWENKRETTKLALKKSPCREKGG